MSNANARRSLDEVARLGDEIRRRRIEPQFPAEDANKFVAIDVDTETYEVDEDDYAAVTRLRKRSPSAEIWLARVGHATACRIGVTQ